MQKSLCIDQLNGLRAKLHVWTDFYDPLYALCTI